VIVELSPLFFLFAVLSAFELLAYTVRSTPTVLVVKWTRLECNESENCMNVESVLSLCFSWVFGVWKTIMHGLVFSHMERQLEKTKKKKREKRGERKEKRKEKRGNKKRKKIFSFYWLHLPLRTGSSLI
jgi:hypothetical protein